MKSNLIMTLGIAALFSVVCLAGAAAEMEIRWHRTDGETKIEYRPINELDGVAVSDEVVSDIFSKFCVGK